MLSLETKKALRTLGCFEEKPGFWVHGDMRFDMDFTATADDKVILRLFQIFAEKGFASCQLKMLEVLGLG